MLCTVIENNYDLGRAAPLPLAIYSLTPTHRARCCLGRVRDFSIRSIEFEVFMCVGYVVNETEFRRGRGECIAELFEV